MAANPPGGYDNPRTEFSSTESFKKSISFTTPHEDQAIFPRRTFLAGKDDHGNQVLHYWQKHWGKSPAELKLGNCFVARLPAMDEHAISGNPQEISYYLADYRLLPPQLTPKERAELFDADGYRIIKGPGDVISIFDEIESIAGKAKIRADAQQRKRVEEQAVRAALAAGKGDPNSPVGRLLDRLKGYEEKQQEETQATDTPVPESARHIDDRVKGALSASIKIGVVSDLELFGYNNDESSESIRTNLKRLTDSLMVVEQKDIDYLRANNPAELERVLNGVMAAKEINEAYLTKRYERLIKFLGNKKLPVQAEQVMTEITNYVIPLGEASYRMELLTDDEMFECDESLKPTPTDTAQTISEKAARMWTRGQSFMREISTVDKLLGDDLSAEEVKTVHDAFINTTGRRVGDRFYNFMKRTYHGWESPERIRRRSNQKPTLP
jgi:hypothetical protein